MYIECKENELICFRLMSGEEVIGRFVKINPSPSDGDSNIMVVSKPRIIAIQFGAKGELSVMLLPLSVNSIESDYEVAMDAVIGHPLKVDPDLEKQYIQTTTRIALVK